MSIGSIGSAFSLGSIGSFASIGSIGSAFSAFSALSFLCSGSIMSARSRNAVMAWRAIGRTSGLVLVTAVVVGMAMSGRRED